MTDAAGVERPVDQGPCSPIGNLTDGRNWTTCLARVLGVAEPEAHGFLQAEEPVPMTPPSPDVDALAYDPTIVGRHPAVLRDVILPPTAPARSIVAEAARDALPRRGGSVGTGRVVTLRGTGGGTGRPEPMAPCDRHGRRPHDRRRGLERVRVRRRGPRR